MKVEQFQAVRGMNDVLPSASPYWAALEETLRQWLASYGYCEIRFPIVEPTGLFVRSIGSVTDIVEKEMYSFVDGLNGEALTLRPEGTASCVRLVIQNHLLHEGPQRLWYTGPMFRHERPQKGRYRQFHQCGVEALGYAGPEVDAELILMTARLWKRLGLTEVSLQLNTIGSSETRARYRTRLRDYFLGHTAVLDEESRRRLETNPLRILDSKNPAMAQIIQGAPSLMEDLDESSQIHFDTLQQLLHDAGQAFELNPRLVRGLDYYNATVFEWVTPLLGAQSTICGGGRYDGLVEQLGGKPTPACGFAMGLERLLALLEMIPVWASRNGPTPEVFVAHHGATGWALRVAEVLREAGVRVLFHAGEGGFKSQMKRANTSGAAFAVILGDEEQARHEVSLKPLRGQGEQQRMTVSEALAIIKSNT
ncbi:MAG: histidine--tRNA ligase [Ferrovum sp.]|nr:histidine--tRNA ligase [Ferrovum sp.]NDU87627.1 histidine--tRNA ligase [Ferrovum sp.]